MSENKDIINNAVDIIKTAILQSQYRAGKSVNSEQLALYYGIGRYISCNSRNDSWGTNAIDEISEDLQRQLPGLRGFSATSLKRMRIFYEQWEMLEGKTTNALIDSTKKNKSSVIMDDLEASNNKITTLKFTNLKKFPIGDFLSIGFTHHYEILSHTSTLEERYFYITKAAEENLSVRALQKALEEDDFHNQKKIPNNFIKTLSKSQQALRAIETFKDSYLLDFINVEELGARDISDVDERVVENSIVHNIKNFMMTFGKDFSFIGNQYHLEIYEIDHYSDLLFFNRELNCLVAVELKTGAFKSAYLGQLTTYLRLLDDKVKKPHENPSIGIILCTSASKQYVEYCIQDYDKPMGVATYKTSSDMPEKLRNALPPIEEMKKLLKDSTEAKK